MRPEPGRDKQRGLTVRGWVGGVGMRAGLGNGETGMAISAPGDSAWVWDWAESWARLAAAFGAGAGAAALAARGGWGGLNWVHSARHSWCGLRGGGAAVAPDTFASECDDKLRFPD